MKSTIDRSKLTLVHGGLSPEENLEGPISRMGLKYRVEPISAKVIAFIIFAKLALLASVLYYLFA